MAKPPSHSIVLAREVRAWELRCKAWSQRRIAEDLGLTQPAVCIILKRICRREAKRLAEDVAAYKAEQTGKLEHILEESIDAWHRSKTPRNRAVRKTARGLKAFDPEAESGDDVTDTTESVERDGDTSYLYVAMNAMANQRRIWGMDVAEASQEISVTVSELSRDIDTAKRAYEAENGAEIHGGGSLLADGRNPGVPIGPEPVQPDDPVP